ncbi:MAG: hypothetical protein J7M40_10245 [Planctomycetes bacterium]|nr:hypothetical protein [Planctomycetota bacterium]
MARKSRRKRKLPGSIFLNNDRYLEYAVLPYASKVVADMIQVQLLTGM